MRSLFFVILVLFLSCEENVKPNSENSGKSILFVGNSLTYWNKGVDFHLQKILESLDIKYSTISSKTNSGFRLKFHWEDSYTFQRFNEMNWDHIVIQESGFGILNDPLESKFYIALFDSLVNADYSAQLSVFQNWSYASENNTWPYIDSVFNSYKEYVNTEFIPIGEAFQLSNSSYPSINLLDGDAVHPSLEGSYLSTAVYFAFLFDENPLESSYIPVGLVGSITTKLNTIAWEIYHKHHSKT